jgi:hypothetical protein
LHVNPGRTVRTQRFGNTDSKATTFIWPGQVHLMRVGLRCNFKKIKALDEFDHWWLGKRERCT